MDSFFIKIVLAIHYTYRAREIFHVSRLSFTLYIYAEIEYIWGKGQNKRRRVIRKRLKKVGQNAEVMPRPLN